MYTYKIVEKALARLHHVNRDGFGALRGRIKHFQRLGMVPSSPGKGQKIVYSLEDVALWVFALELEEFGIDPTVVRLIVENTWQEVRPFLVESGRPETLFLATPNIISRNSWPNVFSYRLVQVDHLKSNFSGHIRVMIFNLTAKREEMLRALEASARPGDNYPDPPTLTMPLQP